MKTSKILLSLFLLITLPLSSQTYPSFGPEIKVSITGLTFDAMEPFISADGNTLFFNSLNSGGNTNLYRAVKVNDSTFTYVGLVNGTYDPSPGHLDAVPSLDSLNEFYWVSLRGYPTTFENLHKGTYSAGTVGGIKRVYGDFNIYTTNWLIMDAAISHTGNQLYYVNAFFNGCAFGIPCEARLGVAQEVNDSTFNKLSNTDAIFANVNDTNYIVYAPQVTHDGLELYYSRIQKTTVNSEILVSVRNSTTDPFSLPQLIHSNLGFVPEAPTLTGDKQKLYYHQKDASGLFKIYLRYRMPVTGIEEEEMESLKVYPNPVKGVLNVDVPDASGGFTIRVYSVMGKEVYRTNEGSMDVSDLETGIYFLSVEQGRKVLKGKFIKE